MIEICEVGPRDGLQNESKLISTETKVELISKLIDSGIRNMEAVSFVNPKVVPQMADAEEVMKLVPKRDDVRYGGLALSASGLERALNTSVDFIHVVTTTSDTFNLRNAKRTVEQALTELGEVIHKGVAANKGILAALGTAFGCPFEGKVPLSRVLHATETFLKAGCTEITLADTTGMANPAQVQHVIAECYKQFGNDLTLGLHFHNTRGLGLANILAGYQAGVRKFDSSIAGLGGCPFAPKAVGNACTEDMVNMFHGMGVETGTDLNKLLETAKWMEEKMERRLDGMVMKV